MAVTASAFDSGSRVAVSDRAAAAPEWRSNWKVVAAATSGMSLAALSTSSIGVMLVPIEQDLGWSRAEISSGPMLISFTVILTGTLVGWTIDRMGARTVALGVIALICGAIAMMSQLGDSIWAWRGLWAIVGLASAAMPTVWLKPVASRFNAGRGLALAVVLTGSGITATVVPLLGTLLVDQFGWRQAYLFLALIWLAVVLPLIVLFLRMPGEAKSDLVEEREPVPSTELPGLTVREGFTSPVFYKLLIGVVASTFVGTALVLNLIPILRESGISPATAAGVVSFIGLSTIGGRIAGGWLMDRLPAGTIAASSTAVMIALPATLLFLPGHVAAAVAAVVLYGMVGGALTPAIAYLASRHLGARSFGTLYATINAAFSIGVGVAPLLANYVFDWTGHYEPVFWAAIPSFTLGALVFASLGPYPDFGDARVIARPTSPFIGAAIGLLARYWLCLERTRWD